MADRPSRNDVDALAKRLDALERQLQDLATKGITVPILNADPAASYPGNLWAYPDGKLNIKLKTGVIKQYTGGTQAAATASNPAPSAQPTTRQNTWAAQWAQAYAASGAGTSANNAMLYQGNGDGVNGRQRSLIGFDYAAIQTALSGADVSAVAIWLSMESTYWPTGATFWFGMHSNTVKPGVWGGTIGRDFVTSGNVPANGGVWINLATEFGARLRDGSSRGVTLQAPNDDRTYYGYAAGGPGTGAERLPQLRITYVK